MANVRVWKEGVIAGVPLATPALLGRTLFSVLGKGIIVSWVVEASKPVPGVLAGLLLFFVIFEAGAYFITAFLAQPETMGSLSWWRVGMANLIAAAMMGGYLWRGHPELKARFSRALVGQS